MINGKGLQVGNRVWESSLDNPSPEDFNEIVIASINDIDKVVCDQQDNIYSYDYIYPISLTPEWLERCGFVSDRNGWHMPETQFSLTDKFFPCWLDRMLWPGGMPDVKQDPLQYLHQLQNLYLALTGEELTIKEIA